MGADHGHGGGEGTDGGHPALPPTLALPDPDALLLCQLAGLEAPLLRHLIAHWEMSAAILRAPPSALRAAGLAPALVARIVAAPRQRAATEAGLQSLERLGIVPLPLLAPAYPARLRESPAAPLCCTCRAAGHPLARRWATSQPEHSTTPSGRR